MKKEHPLNICSEFIDSILKGAKRTECIRYIASSRARQENWPLRKIIEKFIITSFEIPESDLKDFKFSENDN